MIPDSVLISVATYDEIDNLPRLVDAIFRSEPGAHILVVDDDSPDGTGRWAEEFSRRDSRLTCIHREGKLGLGTATIEGLQHGIDRDYRYIVTMDADFSHNPEYLHDLIAGMESDRRGPVDVVIGSRYAPGGRVEGWPLGRRWMSRAVNAFARRWLRLSVKDTSGAFRCYRTATLRKLDLSEVRSRGYSVFEELLWLLRREGARMAETPITFIDRDSGRSKVTVREAAVSLFQIIRLRGH